MYFLTALACTIIATVLWFFFRDRKNLHLDILAITYGASTLMWLIDCIFSAVKEGAFISFDDPAELATDGWISLATILGGIFFWLVLSFILNNRQKQEA